MPLQIRNFPSIRFDFPINNLGLTYCDQNRGFVRTKEPQSRDTLWLFHSTLWMNGGKYMAGETCENTTAESLKSEIKSILKDISAPKDSTQRNDNQRVEINFFENPLNPNLLAYCFDIILEFDVRYRIFEKVNYIIDFDYKGTFASVGHFKMSYRLSIEKQYREEIISSFNKVRPLLEKLFMIIGEQALISNEFSMVNESRDYFSKLAFYEKRINSLARRKEIVEEKCRGKYDIIETDGKYKCMQMKGSDYLHALKSEIIYDIESYIDTFFSALEHVLTLLYPFTERFKANESHYKRYIRNTKWHWENKIQDVFGDSMPDRIISALRRIKEVYRNHNAHGSFSREMMAYVQIPSFGRFPMYVGKEYLRGFIDGYSDKISYEMYLDAKKVFAEFWKILDTLYEIPMLYVRSGLPISVDTNRYTENIDTVEQADWLIAKMWHDIDNQSNMEW